MGLDGRILAGTSRGEDDEQPCPICGVRSFLCIRLDQFIHLDGSANRGCMDSHAEGLGGRLMARMNREEAMALHPAGKQPRERTEILPWTQKVLRKGQFANGLLWWFGPGGDEW